MKQVCVIGNSHAAPLMGIAQDGALSRRGIQPTFFVCHVSLLQGLAVSGRSLVARTDELRTHFVRGSGGAQAIEVDRYDEFVIVGHEFFMGHFLNLCRSYRSDTMGAQNDERYLLSDDCLMAWATGRLVARCEAFRVARLIRQLCDKPVTVVAEPNPGQGLALSEVPWWMESYYVAEQSGEGDAVAALFGETCRRLAEQERIRIIPPLPELAASALFNRREFCLLSEESADGKPVDRVSAMLHSTRSSGDHLLRHLFG